MQNLNQILQKYSSFFLALIFVLALLLRWLYLPQNAISFAYDQARDAFTVIELLTGHIKVLGPSVSGVPGLFHGVLYYYVIAPAYYFGDGNPAAVAYFLSFISSLGVFVVYFLTKILTKNKVPALIASLFFACSFELTQYSNLMTNASMGVWFIPIVYIGLYSWIKRLHSLAPLVVGISLGLSIQSEIALAYHVVPVLLWLFIFRKKINHKQIIVSIIGLLLALSTMIISEVKFGFTGIRGLLYLLSGGDAIAQSRNLGDYILTLINQSGKTFAYTIFPVSIVFGGLIGFLLIVTSVFINIRDIKKNILTWETMLISWIFAYGVALPFGGSNMKHILVGVAPAVTIYMGIFLWKYFTKSKLIFAFSLLLILISNIYMVVKENKDGQTIFPLQKDLVLNKEISLVDYTYSKSKGEQFSISSLTSPLFVNTLWSYLYNWHGLKKYGYIPSWFGRDQVGQLGNNLKFAPSNVYKHFFIIEPTYGIPEQWVLYAYGDQNSMSNLVSQKSFGDLTVQERITKK